jgi:hypothetical protein
MPKWYGLKGLIIIIIMLQTSIPAVAPPRHIMHCSAPVVAAITFTPGGTQVGITLQANDCRMRYSSIYHLPGVARALKRT